MTSISDSTHVSRRFILGGLLSTAASTALANAPKRSPRPEHRGHEVLLQAAGGVEDLIEAASLGGAVSFVVADAATGETLESHNPKQALPPASVTKAVTTLYGLAHLGSAYRYKTQILANGTLANGRLTGDIYLVGSGDPTLDTDALGELARRLKAAGLREVSGKAYVYGGALPYQKSIDPSQPDYLGYNPSLSGLNLNYNRVFFEWKREGGGFSVTMDARAIKYRPRVAMASMQVVDRATPIFTLKSSARQDNWTVASKALGRKGGRWLPVRRPQFYAAEVFHTLARSHGIDLPRFVAAGRPPSGTVLAEWQSEPLNATLRGMMKYSTNLIAEAVGVTASQAKGKTPKSLSSSGRMMSVWINAQSGSQKAKFVDHSGLGEDSRISSGDMVKILNYAGWDDPLRNLMKDIPLRDKKGKEIKNHPVEVQAKTGTLNFVSALAGYVRTPKGRKLSFAIFTADMPRRAKIPKAQRERPLGARGWNKRSKVLQQQLIERWATVFEG